MISGFKSDSVTCRNIAHACKETYRHTKLPAFDLVKKGRFALESKRVADKCVRKLLACK